MKKYIDMKWLYFAISLLFVACAINEEETVDINYRPSLFLHHHFLNDEKKDVVDDVVNTTTYYIYNTVSGQYFNTFTTTHNSVSIDSVLYGVPEGNYTVIACGNLSVAKWSGKDVPLSNANISIASIAKCTGTENLFMSVGKYDVARELDTITPKDIYFDNKSIHISMEVRADENVEGGVAKVETYLKNVSAGYDFSGASLGNTASIYPEFVMESNLLKKADFYVYSFNADDPIAVGMEVPDQNVPDVLISEYLKYSEETLKGDREQSLKIVIDVSPVGITVKINDWILGSKQEEEL